jgi:hypothetical protein
MLKRFSELPPVEKKIFEEISMIAEPIAQEEVAEPTGVVALFSKLFESKELSRVYHLQVRGEEGSYATHVALGIYYEAIAPLVDDLVEIYQGQYDIVEGYTPIQSDTGGKPPIEYFNELAAYIKAVRFTLLSQEDTHLQNIVDEIVALIYKTLYRLKFNK